MSTRNDIPTTDGAAKDEPRTELELEAKRAERRLLATLEKVDHRRHRIVEEVERFPRRLLASLVAAGAVVGVIAAALAVRRRRASAPPSYGMRLDALQRAWTHPDWVASNGRRSGGGGLVKHLGVTALSAAASILVTHLARRGMTVILAEDTRD
jgi:hypothetical protein